MGSYYITSPSLTSIVSANTPVKAAGTTALSDNTMAYLFDMPANNRLRYTGTPDVHAHIAISTSMTASANQKIVELSVYKNGTTKLAHSVVRRFVSTGSDIGSTALHADCMLSTNDYIELWVANGTDDTDITIQYLYVFAVGMFV